MLDTIFAVALAAAVPSEIEVSRLVTNAQMEPQLMQYNFTFQAAEIPALESPILTVKDNEGCDVVYNRSSSADWQDFTSLTDTPKQALNMVSLVILHEIGHCAIGKLDVATVREDKINFVWSRNEEVQADAFALKFAKANLPADEYHVLYYQWMHYRMNNRHSLSHDTYAELKSRDYLRPAYKLD